MHALFAGAKQHNLKSFWNTKLYPNCKRHYILMNIEFNFSL